MSDIQGEAVVFETSYVDRPVGREHAVSEETPAFMPDFTDIHICRVVCRDARTAIAASGSLQTVHDIFLADCVFFYTETAVRVDDPAMLHLDHVRLETY